MKTKVLIFLIATVLTVGGAIYAFTGTTNCPLAGTKECPLIKNCPKKGTADCPYTKANCCAKK